MSEKQGGKKVLITMALIFLFVGAAAIFAAVKLPRRDAVIREITETSIGHTGKHRRRVYRERVNITWVREDGSEKKASIRIGRRREDDLPGVGETIQIVTFPVAMEYSPIGPFMVGVVFLICSVSLFMAAFRKKKE